MMSITDTNIQKLIINRLTQEKYDELLSSNQINDNELYITDTNDDSYSKPETDELLAQKADIQAVYTKYETDGLFTEIDDKINTITIPTKTSELVNDSGYITNIPNEYITETELNDKGYLTEHQDITGKADITYLNERLELKSDKSDTYTKDEVNSLLENIEVSGGSLPNQIDNEGKFLSTNGSTAEWSSIGKFSDTIDSMDIDLNRVIINRLTQAQYDELSVNGQLKEDEIYVTDTVPYTKEEVDELLNGIGTPTKTSDLINDSDFITSEAVKNNVKLLDDEHKNILLSNGTYDGKDVEDGFVFTSPDGKLVGFDKTLNPGGDWGTSQQNAQEYVETHGVYGNGIIIIPAGQYNTVNKSIDKGVTWTYHTSVAHGGQGGVGSSNYCFNDGKFIGLNSGWLRTSTDGVNWSATQTNAGSSAGIAFGNGRYVTRVDKVIKYSDDGLNWSTAETPISLNFDYSLTAFDNNFMFVGGYNIVSSTDGENWTLYSKPSGNGRQCAGGNGTWVIVDSVPTSNSSNKVFYSKDNGATWNTTYTPSQRIWSGLSWCGDRFFMVGYNSDAYAYSFDGVTWIEGKMPTSAKWYTVTYADGTIVVTTKTQTNVAYASFNPFYEYSLTDLSFNKAEVEENYALKSDIPPEIDTSKFLQNQANESWSQSIGIGTTGDPAIVKQYAATAIGGDSEAHGNQSVAVGTTAKATAHYSTAVGALSEARAENSVAIGRFSIANAENSAQVGYGQNNTPGTMQFRNWTLVDANGNIPLERLSNIEIPSVETLPDQTNNGGKVLTTNGDEASWNHIINLNDITTLSSEGLSNLVLNKLTQAEYNALLENNQINDNELYIITDTNNVFATKDEIPTNISELNNDIGYITQDELSNQYVDTTTNQDIGGLKTFLAEEVVIRNNNMSFGTTPVSRLESRIVFKGSDGKPINNITCNRYPDGSTYIEFHIHAQNNAWSQPNTCLRFGHNGTSFLAEVPNPTTDSNSREIATTSWVMQKLGDIGNILDTINGEVI